MVGLGVGCAKLALGAEIRVAAHRDEIRVAVDGGEEMDRGAHSLISIEKCRQIEQLLLDGKLNPKQIADLVGCGVSTVRRAQNKLTKPGEDHLSQRQSA